MNDLANRSLLTDRLPLHVRLSQLLGEAYVYAATVQPSENSSHLFGSGPP